MDLKTLIVNKKILIDSGQGSGRKVESWQDYAANICKEFNIVNKKVGVVDKNGNYRTYTKNITSIIFRHAKFNKSWLEGKVVNMRELRVNYPQKWKELEKADKLANYFIATFRKNNK